MEIETLSIWIATGVNVCVAVWNVVQTIIQFWQRKKMAEIESNLERQVHRLSVHLNQEIIRLNRINELMRGMYLSVSRQNHKIQLIASDRAKDAISRMGSDEFRNEMTDTAVTLGGSYIEMKAIANVIGDSELLSLIEKLTKCVIEFDLKESAEARRKRHREFGQQATAVLEKVYTMLQEVVDSA